MVNKSQIFYNFSFVPNFTIDTKKGKKENNSRTTYALVSQKKCPIVRKTPISLLRDIWSGTPSRFAINLRYMYV